MALKFKNAATGDDLNYKTTTGQTVTKQPLKFKSASDSGKTAASGLVKRSIPQSNNPPAAKTQQGNALELARKAIANQQTPKGIGFANKQQYPSLGTMPKVNALPMAQKIQQKAQGLTPQQVQQKNLQTMKDGLGTLPKSNVQQVGIGFRQQPQQPTAPVKTSMPAPAADTLQRAKQIPTRAGDSNAMYYAKAVRSGLGNAAAGLQNTYQMGKMEDAAKLNGEKTDFVSPFANMSGEQGLRDNIATLANNLATNFTAALDRNPSTILRRWLTNNLVYTDEQAKEQGYSSKEEMIEDVTRKAMAATDWNDEIQQDFADTGEKKGVVKQTAASIVQNIAQMAPQIASNLVVPGSGLPMMAAQVYGNSAMEALDKGATLQQASNRGALSAATEVGTEKLFGGIPGLEKGLIKLGRVGNMLGEGVEEGISTALSGAIDRATFDPTAENATMGDIARDALMGAAVSGVMQIPGMVTDIATDLNSGENNTAAKWSGAADGEFPSVANIEVETETAPDDISPVTVGRATKIYSPYQGPTPDYSKPANNTVPNIEKAAVNTAAEQIQKARESSQAGTTGFKKSIKKFYEQLFAKKGGSRNVRVNGATFDGAPYEVSLGRRAVSKVVNDPNISPEKLAIFDNIDAVISNGEYVGSGSYSQKGNKVKNTIRYDYFETPATINGKPCIVTFDVEVIPTANNYRTHKVINNMDLTLSPSAHVGPAPTASGEAPSPAINIAQNQQTGKTQNAVPASNAETQTASNRPASLRQRAEQNQQAETPYGRDRQSWMVQDWAEKLKRRFGLGMDAEKLSAELNALYKNAEQTGWTEQNTERLDKLAKELLASETGTVNRERTQQIKDAKAYLRKITLPVTAEMKAEIESRFGNWNDFKKSHRNQLKLKLVDGPTNLNGIDTHYDQLHDLCPEWFPEGIENASDYDIMAHVVNFVDNATEVRDYALNQDQDAALTEIAGQLWEGYAQIQQAMQNSREANATMFATDMESRAESAKNAEGAVADMLRDEDAGMLETETGDLSDIAEALDGHGAYMNLDIYRALDKVAGKNQELRQRLHEAIEKPLNDAKAKYAQNIVQRMNNYKAEMDRLGIKIGSKESAAVQWYGEGQRQVGKNGATEPYGLGQLQEDFPDTWQNIVEAERIHRQIYDDYVDRINQALAEIYPDVEANANTELTKKQEAFEVAKERLQLQQELVQGLIEQANQLEAQAKSLDRVEGNKARQELVKVKAQMKKEGNTLVSRENALKKAAEAYNKLNAEIESGSYFRNKRLMPRKDYFHHFVEMEEGLGGLKNILSRPSDIAPNLVGTSDNTKPKSKFWGALQRRTGAAYTEDAIAGMARYIPAAEYKINIDPVTAQLRGTVKSLVDATQQTRNANGFIEFLTDYANDLAGKTNPLDRGIQKVFGRKAMKTLEWVNNRVKSNAVVGNLGSAVVQIGNIPNATTYVQNPITWAKAAATLANPEKANLLLAQSPFLTERFMENTTGMFDQKNVLQKGSEWVLEIGDKKASELIWLAAYNQYNDSNGNVKGPRLYDNAIDYADDVTRRSVAGRGVGEVPLTQKSRMVKLLAPFQVEVNNAYNLMKEQIGAKNARGLIAYCASAWLTNALIEAVAGKRPVFDPIQALLDAIKLAQGDDEEEGDLGAAVKRLAGEAASNMPYISTFAPLFVDVDDMAKVFGEDDPTRYGTGMSATQEAFTQLGNLMSGKPVDVLGLATTYVTPYGGQQLERIVKAGQNFGYIPKVTQNDNGTQLKRQKIVGSYNDSGKLRFAMEPNALNFGLNAAFGDYATVEGREYLESGSIMSAKNTDIVNRAPQEALLPAKTAQKVIQELKDVDGTATKRKYIHDQKNLTQYQKAWLEHELLASDTVKEKAKLAQSRGIPLNVFYWVKENSGTQEETEAALNRAPSLNRGQKKWMWSVLTGGKEENNPFR